MLTPGIDEFRQRYSGRYFGKYRGVVVKVGEDDRKLIRITTRVPVILGDQELGWALPSDGGGLRNGRVWAPSPNDFVWIEFEEGDPSRPIWSHGPWGNRDNESMLPKHARGETEEIDEKIRNVGIINPSTFAGEYPNVKIMRSVSGHLLEFDDTENEQRVQLAHNNGSRIEMLADESVEFVTKGELRQFISEAMKIEVIKALEVLSHEASTFESEDTTTIKSAGGEILMNSSSSPAVQVGGSGATEPFVKGNKWSSLMNDLLTLLARHTHVATPPTGVPVEASEFLALILQLADSLSDYLKSK